MTHNNDKCEICDAQRVGESPECDAVFADYPQLVEMEDIDAKGVLVEAFKATHKLRCEFMHWLISMKLAKPDPLALGLLEIAYKLPEGVSLRPAAMMELEEQLQQMAQAGNSVSLIESAKLYVERFKNFIEGQHRLLTPEEN